MNPARTALLLLAAWNCGAGEFRNLGFEDGERPFFLPGWTTVQPVGLNVTRPFADSSSILDSSYRNTTQPASPAKVPVVGTYSLGIWPSAQPDSISGIPPGFTLKQTGDIPVEAQSLRFLYAGPGDFKVYVGGAERLVHFTESRPSGDPEIPSLDYFVVDVGLFAGQNAELRFEFFSFGNYPGQDGGQIPGWPDAKFHVLDDLSFSPLPAVPEPATWVLAVVGCAALVRACRRRS
jgi:hypothetical protein